MSLYRQCSYPGCSALVAAGRCEQHRAAGRREQDRWRGSAASRGYDRTWRRVRLMYLAEYPLCADCEALGRAQAATEVHHRAKVADAPERRLDPGNLMALCHECHASRTGRGE